MNDINGETDYIRLSSPFDIARARQTVETTRLELLFANEEGAVDPLAQQHYCMALALLSQASHQLEVARIHQARLAGELARQELKPQLQLTDEQLNAAIERMVRW